MRRILFPMGHQVSASRRFERRKGHAHTRKGNPLPHVGRKISDTALLRVDVRARINVTSMLIPSGIIDHLTQSL